MSNMVCKDDPAPSPEEARALLEKLTPIQEAKGYFFNKDTSLVLELLQQLSATKKAYGYMSCPCRLANGTYENDKDIICPCVYREPDVKEFGACFCKLYVGKAQKNADMTDLLVPERRPPEKILW